MPNNATIFPKSEVISYLFQLIGYYNLSTAKHSCRVAKLAVGFAVRLGLSFQIIQLMSAAALLHGIGKII